MHLRAADIHADKTHLFIGQCIGNQAPIHMDQANRHSMLMTGCRGIGTLNVMPFDLTWEPNGVYRRYMGHVTITERRQSLELICADVRFDALRYTITDYLGAISYEITPEATLEIASLHVGPVYTNPHIVIAAVVTEPNIIEAIKHFISLGMVPVPYRIFSTAQAAREWIATEPRSIAARRQRF